MVEDPFVRVFLRTLLARYGYTALGVELERALDLLSSGELQPDVLITNTPGIFERFAAQVPLLYLSACPDPDLAARFQSCRALQKPFHPDQMLAAVEELAGSL